MLQEASVIREYFFAAALNSWGESLSSGMEINNNLVRVIRIYQYGNPASRLEAGNREAGHDAFYRNDEWLPYRVVYFQLQINVWLFVHCSGAKTAFIYRKNDRFGFPSGFDPLSGFLDEPPITCEGLSGVPEGEYERHNE